MDINSLTLIDVFRASIEIALAIAVIIKIKNWPVKISFTICALVTALWQVNYPLLPEQTSPNLTFFLLDSLRYFAWIIALFHLMLICRRMTLPLYWALSLYSIFATLLAILIFENQLSIPDFSGFSIALYLKLMMCLLGIIFCEQILRYEHSSRMAKVTCLAALMLFLFDTFTFSNNILFSYFNSDIWLARSGISTFTSLILALNVIFYSEQLNERAKFKLSNSVILFNTSLTLVGLFFILMALVVSAISFFDLQWLALSKILLYVAAIFVIVTLSFSEKIRLRIIVWTSKHFFAHKYDYKKQWITLESYLSNQGAGCNCYDKSLHALLKLFNCNSGGIWLPGQQFFSAGTTKNLDCQQQSTIVENNSSFINKLKSEDWIFQVGQHSQIIDTQYNALLPDWLAHLPNLWVVVPLNTEDKLIGFAVLCKNKLSGRLTWEDLDILKLTGRQIASYISRQQAYEQLIHNQQFDLFNKITTFAIHDIKNLIAQQDLVVKNAEKYKHIPEFVDDAIETIANSVQKMDLLLVKLQGNTQQEIQVINLQELIIEAIAMNSSGAVVPVANFSDEAFIKADKDKLLMALNHLIKNAQDACTDKEGKIDIHLYHHHEAFWIDVVDNGIGMSQAFIANQLFKPFTSTKDKKGMGIGVYQIKEIITNLNGDLLVESTEGQGSKFSIYLPLNTHIKLSNSA